MMLITFWLVMILCFAAAAAAMSLEVLFGFFLGVLVTIAASLAAGLAAASAHNRRSGGRWDEECE
jgi:hypothetical protein